jgi:hypothetical protein
MRWKNVDVPKFERSEISINYEVSGSGPRVLFFNGSGATLKSAALLINALAKTCTVLDAFYSIPGIELLPMFKVRF